MAVFNRHFSDILIRKITDVLNETFASEIEKLELKNDEALTIIIKDGLAKAELLGLKKDDHRCAYIVLSIYNLTKRISDKDFDSIRKRIAKNNKSVLDFVNMY